MRPVTTEICMALAEALEASDSFQQIARTAYGAPWAIHVGADIRVILADVHGPHCLLLPGGVTLDNGPQDAHDLSLLLAVVDDATLQDPERLRAYDVLERQSLRQILRETQNLPFDGYPTEVKTELSIEKMPLAILNVRIVYGVNSPIGAKLF